MGINIKYLDLDGLRHYNRILQERIGKSLGNTLEEALSLFKGALVPRGIIKNTGASSIDLRSGVYAKAKLGDTYFIGDSLLLTYKDNSGQILQDIAVEKGDAAICFVQAELSESGEVVSDAMWGILQANWNLKTFPEVRVDVQEAQSTVTIAEIEGQPLQFQVPAATEMVNQLKGAMGRAGIVKFATTPQEENQNITDEITEESLGDKIPTDMAVREFVKNFTPNAVTGIDILEPMEGDTRIGIIVTGGNNEGMFDIPPATEKTPGVMTARDKKDIVNLRKAVTENNIALHPLEVTVTGVNNPYEEGVENRIPIYIDATHKGEGLYENVEYKVAGNTVTEQPYTIVVSRSSNIPVVAEYTGYEYLGEKITLKKGVSIKIFCVKPFWAGGSSLESITFDNINEQWGFTKFVKTSPEGIYDITLDAEGYIWVCVPYEMVITKVTSDGFEVPVTEKQILDSNSNIYRCYRSDNKLIAGTYKLTIS